MPPAKRGSLATDPGILLKRRKDRQKANERLQLRLDEQGVRRAEVENNLSFSSIPQVLLINQKNYYTEYLKKDENLRIVRNTREKLNKKLKVKTPTTGKRGDLDRVKNGSASVSVSASANVTENENDDDDNENDDNDEDGEDAGEDDQNRTLVIHPGSHDIKIGWAEDVDPVLVPNLIGYIRKDETSRAPADMNSTARAEFDVSGLDPPRYLAKGDGEPVVFKGKNGQDGEEGGANDEEDEGDRYFLLNDDKSFRAKRKPIVASFRERMKYYKRRILPNCHEACFNFNSKQQRNPPGIEDISEDVSLSSSTVDMFIRASKWRETSGRDYVVGEEVFRLADEKEWMVRSPFLFSSVGSISATSKRSSVELGFNEQDLNYSSREEILGDIETMLYHTIMTKFKVAKKSDLKKINVVLVIPSLYRKSYVESMMELLLMRMNFKNATLIQEGMSASFGLGLSTGCIVDIGATSIHICCVDDGAILEDTRVSLDYGMADVVRFWGKNLIAQQFPYVDVDFRKVKDWKLIEGTFADHGTFDDSKVAIQVGKFSVYESNTKVRRYQFKCFDEGIVCPMGLFYPDIFVEEATSEVGGEGEEDEAVDNQKERILLGSISPPKRIHAPLFEGRSNKFTGYSNSDPISILQDLQRTGVKISELNVEQLLELLVELSELFINSNTIGSGRRGKTNDISSKLKSRYRNAHYAQQKDQEKGDDAAGGDKRTDRMRQNMTPLDRAIIESITVAGLSDQSRLEKMYSNICLVGGGGRLDGFDSMLMDRLHINRNEILSSSKLVDALNLIKQWKRTFEKEQKQRAKEKEEEKEKERLKEEKEGDGPGEHDKGKEKPKAGGDDDDDDDGDDDEGSDDDTAAAASKSKSSTSATTKSATPAPTATAAAASAAAAPAANDVDNDDDNDDDELKLSKEQLREVTDLLLDGTPIAVDITGKGELDPLVLGWKGGCVYARLKIFEETWMNAGDWDILGSRSLTYGSLFSY